MATLSFNGLSSGIDTAQVVSSLMAIERAPVQRMEERVGLAKARAAKLDDLRTRLQGVRDAATALRDVSLLDGKPSALSSDATRVGASATGSAVRASYRLDVAELARTGVITQGSTMTAAASADVLHVGFAGSTPGFDVAVAAGDTVGTIAERINAAGGGATASVVEGRLRLTSKASGAADMVALSSTGGLASALGMTTTLAGRDARFSIDGVEQTRATNRVDDAIGGVTLDLRAVTSAPVTLDVDPQRIDVDGAVGAMKRFVGAYNALVDGAESALAERPVRSPKTQAERERGLLFGDDAVASLLDSARRALQDPVAGAAQAYDTAQELGLSTGASTGAAASTSGRLVLDEARLRAAIAADPSAVEEALGRAGTGGDGGLMTRLEAIGERFGSSTEGVLRGRVRIEERRIADWQDGIQRTDARLQLREDHLRAQFTAMERSLGQLQTLQGALGLPGGV